MNKRIVEWAQAIQEFEGWKPGSRSFRNNNPGNIKGGSWAFQKGKDADGYVIFDSYQDGFGALYTLLYRAAWGKSRIYNPADSLLQFFELYAPRSDGNRPSRYARFVGKKLGVSIDTPISHLL